MREEIFEDFIEFSPKNNLLTILRLSKHVKKPKSKIFAKQPFNLGKKYHSENFSQRNTEL